eukprot:TRINITY_DN6877_c0_g1_i5.p2 TRINITY_DN6877_c0_g1~~TRINITY_DN6877_c0_g1_i5.p2  ORF type:complete len:102 (+),score=24.87 TRINITY_DN6877_c0_g1_i5:95-400(+)
MCIRDRFRYWAAGEYPGEGFSDAAYFFEVKYAGSGEFEYVKANELWEDFERIPLAAENGGAVADDKLSVAAELENQVKRQKIVESLDHYELCGLGEDLLYG